MRKKSNSLRRLPGVSVQRFVRPVAMALLYVNPNGAPYRLVTRGGIERGWSTLYKGEKKVWGCNATFASLNFADWSNDQAEAQPVAAVVERNQRKQNE